MATMTASTAVIAKCGSVFPVPEFQGLKASVTFKALPKVAMISKSAKLKVSTSPRCDYIGSSTNLVMVGATTLLLVAGRFGLAPSANRKSTAGLKLMDRDSGLKTGDPAGFTGTDTLAFGALGHILGVGIVLGLKATGGL